MATATLIWDGTTITGNIVELEGVYETPDVRTSDVDRSRAHGQWPGVDLLGGRAITATIQANSPLDSQDWPDGQRALTPASDERVLQVQLSGFAGGETVRCLARVRRLAVPVDVDRYQFGVPQVVVEWWATDPRFYADTETSASAEISSPTGAGLTFDVTFDLGFGGAIPAGVVNVDNDGNFAAPWVAEITGPVVNPRVESVTGGRTLRLAGSVQAGETLRIDSATKTVTLDGASRYSWLVPGSQWFDLNPGSNQVRFAASSGTGVGTLTFRSAWV